MPEQKEDQPALTPDGNMTLIDDILQNDNFASVEEGETVGNKQFKNIQSIVNIKRFIFLYRGYIFLYKNPGRISTFGCLFWNQYLHTKKIPRRI